MKTKKRKKRKHFAMVNFSDIRNFAKFLSDTQKEEVSVYPIPQSAPFNFVLLTEDKSTRGGVVMGRLMSTSSKRFQFKRSRRTFEQIKRLKNFGNKSGLPTLLVIQFKDLDPKGYELSYIQRYAVVNLDNSFHIRTVHKPEQQIVFL